MRRDKNLCRSVYHFCRAITNDTSCIVHHLRQKFDDDIIASITNIDIYLVQNCYVSQGEYRKFLEKLDIF